jgi:DNA-directed RNA polymerase specialized sigma subunit
LTTPCPLCGHYDEDTYDMDSKQQANLLSLGVLVGLMTAPGNRNGLTRREFEVYILKYCDLLSSTDAGRVLGITPQSVDTYEKRALKKIEKQAQKLRDLI